MQTGRNRHRMTDKELQTGQIAGEPDKIDHSHLMRRIQATDSAVNFLVKFPRRVVFSWYFFSDSV
jgi:hypothetical protein